jgi:hypothetical protein
MDGPQHERRRHFRGKARPGRVLAIRFRAGDADASWVTAETRNIGVGGAFIVTNATHPIGASLAVEVMPPTSAKFALPAIVRWVAQDGMGVQFVNADVDVLLELNDYFATLTGG